MAYYPDWSEFAIFTSEIEALRHAVDASMRVIEIQTGVGIRETYS